MKDVLIRATIRGYGGCWYALFLASKIARKGVFERWIPGQVDVQQGLTVVRPQFSFQFSLNTSLFLLRLQRVPLVLVLQLGFACRGVKGYWKPHVS